MCPLRGNKLYNSNCVVSLGLYSSYTLGMELTLRSVSSLRVQLVARLRSRGFLSLVHVLFTKVLSCVLPCDLVVW